LIERLEADGRFTTLLAAIDALDARDVLRDPGPITLFAPTDAAFDALAATDPLALPALLGDPGAIAILLDYHLADGDLDDAALRAAARIETRDGRPIRVEAREVVVFNGVARPGPALVARNGRAHPLDRVLVPPAPCFPGEACAAGLACGAEGLCLPPPLPVDLVETLRRDGRFATLLGFIDAAGLAPTLRGRRLLTVIAPTDDAFADFAAADPGAFAAVRDDPDTRLRALRHHLVDGTHPALAATDLLISREALPIAIGDGGATLGGAPVEPPPLIASNGVVHVVGAVLTPPARAPNIDCSAPVPIDAPGFYPGDTTLGEDQAQASCGGAAEGPDTTFALTFADGGPVCVTPRGAEWPLVLHARRGTCNDRASEIACSDGARADDGLAALDLALAPGETIYVFVDGHSDPDTGAIAAGAYILEVRPGLCDPPPDLVDALTEDGRFTTLVDALAAADLDGALRGDGPFTVFAPTDDAFAALAAEDPALFPALLADPATLAAVLAYHVVPGDRPRDTLTDARLDTLEGRPIRAEAEGDALWLNQTARVGDERAAANGRYHAIDAVLLPPERCGADGDCEPGFACAAGEGICLPAPLPPPIPAVLAADGRFATLLAALAAAGLADVLAAPGPWTLFAPTDDAFAALGPAAVQALLDDPAALAERLGFHLVAARLGSRAVMDAAATGVLTFGGLLASVALGADGIRVGGARIIAVDIPAANGVIHALDAVAAPIDACAAPPPIALGEALEGTTADAADRTVADCASGAADGVEIARRLVVDADGPVCLSTRGSDFDTLLYLTGADCEGPQLACADDIDFLDGRLTSELTVELTAGAPYHVFVAAWPAGVHGTWRLEATPGACPADR
ncbi:MAG: fasciclin domain-containing protein, partial [bacterium]